MSTSKTVHDSRQAEAENVKNSVETKIGSLNLDSLRFLKAKIIKVPDGVRKGHDDAYEPKMVVIGPYHRKKDNSSHMEKIKLLYVDDLLKRDRSRNELSKYAAAILEKEEEARNMYSADLVDMKREEFVEMLLVDGCYVIEFLLKRAEGLTDPINAGKLTSPTIRRDLLLLENQIPFFILRIILENSNWKNITEFPKGTATLLDLSLRYLNKEGNITKDSLKKEHQNEDNIYHLLHLSYLCVFQRISPETTLIIDEFTLSPCPCFPVFESCRTHSYRCFIEFILSLFGILKKLGKSIRRYVAKIVIYLLYGVVNILVMLIFWRNPISSISNNLERAPRTLPTATQLEEAGITFKKKQKENNHSYLNVSFNEEGDFEIPTLFIQENTESTFRNFLAFEQTCPEVGNDFTSYIVLMDNLIDTSSDVAILKQHGLLESKLGCDGDVADLFNQMRSGLCFDFNSHYLKEVFEGVNRHCSRKHNRWRAQLMHDYFSSPWAAISVIAAVLLLVLTATQTVYSVKAFNE